MKSSLLDLIKSIVGDDPDAMVGEIDDDVCEVTTSDGVGLLFVQTDDGWHLLSGAEWNGHYYDTLKDAREAMKMQKRRKRIE